ncbi:protein FAM53B isoform X1 [Xiphophorus maculatus]|uniref:Family with sequence similarity 53 member B n=1 Tax=Xiphophorus maculatus TaxID=8083 RepID=M4AQ19_XIPMA|nr:protein FAM53B isoform X1 [Xiphophorus maculatus]XP_023196366.1 protein FAM53B isoform X1 [Xiphophorus maculatus]
MRVVMVIIYKKTVEKKGGDDVTTKRTDLGTAQTMSQGAALFSCGLMETSRWREVGTSCALQQRPVGTSLESLWDVLPDVHRTSAHWGWDVGSTSSTISSLLQDLSLTDASHSTAPPSKRQCRSLSCSDELSSCRSTWRPQGSRVWTSVEKRRCHSGGSVQRSGLGNSQLCFPAMQRSSSFSLPARSDGQEQLCFPQLSSRPSAFSGPTPNSSDPSAQSLYLSHEQICLPEAEEPSPASSPDSTPELERRGGEGGLARSRSQPCVLNDKKIGVKRRRPADSQKQRPSLDLAKMTQKLRNFHSLSCPGITSDDPLKSGPAALSLRPNTDDLSDNEDGPELNGNESSDTDWNHSGRGDNTMAGTTGGKDGETLWVGLCSMTRDMYQLGGELDIEQIERN